MWKLSFMLFRGGTSKGPFFMRSTLPSDPLLRDKILLDLMGSPHQIQVDGIGGGHALSNKACIVGASKREGVDVDYLICQVHVNKPLVETTIDCGNMLAAVAPYAIETGLVKAEHPETKVRIYSENTGVIIEAVVQTPGGRKACYDGDTRIDGVSGTGAPIKLSFLNPVGSTTGSMLPTGRVIDLIGDVEVTCLDVSMPMVIVSAESFGKTGYESKAELDSDRTFMDGLEDIRKRAARLMGLGDATGKTIPKICLVSRPKEGGNIASRYMISPFEYDCHPSFAVTGAMCLSAACYIPGSVANKYASLDGGLATEMTEKQVCIEHPLGRINACVKLSMRDAISIDSVSYIRTARPLASGEVFVPGEPTKEFKDIVFLQAHFRGVLARRRSKTETQKVVKFVIEHYKSAVSVLLENEKLVEAADLIELVRNKKFIEAERKLKLIFEEYHPVPTPFARL